MGGVLHRYVVIQQNHWAGRRFFSAQDRRTGQAVYLIAEPSSAPPLPASHPGLPPVEVLQDDGDLRWLIVSMPEGETLEDLRYRGALTEQDVVATLLSVLDGLMGLAALEPPPVPGYLDPACIRRDWMGRWTLDYLALAHATEARRRQSPPLGVYPFGALLYWLATGELARFTRVRPGRVPVHLTPALQFIMMRCLGQSYPSLAALRADIERAGRSHDFRPLVQQIGRQRAGSAPSSRPASPAGPAGSGAQLQHGAQQPVRPAGAGRKTVRIAGMDPRAFVEQHRAALDSPRIPLDDRPWALPPRPREGYRKYTVPPPPNPAVQKVARWAMLTAFGAVVAAATGWGAYRLGLVPDEVLPPALRQASPVNRIPGTVEAGVELGAGLSPEPEPEHPEPQPSQGPDSSGPEAPDSTDRAEAPQQPSEPADGGEPSPGRADPFAPPADAEPAPPDQPPSGQPEAGQPESGSGSSGAPDPAGQTGKPDAPPSPPPDSPGRTEPTPPEPADPAEPEAGSIAYLDKQLGAKLVSFFLNGRYLRDVYMFPHDRNPYISLEAYNELFGRHIVWMPVSGGRIRLLDDDLHILTYSYYRIRDRILLKLGPELQAELGLQLNAYNEVGIFFSTVP